MNATPTYAEIAQRRARGQTHADIARECGVTKQAVGKVWRTHLNRADQTERERVRDDWPWTSTAQQTQSEIERNLRNHQIYLRGGEHELSRKDRDRLRWFYRRLIEGDQIAVYDPSIPPGEYDAAGGYALVPRRATDHDYVLRPSTHESPNLHSWSIPEVWPFTHRA